MPCNLTPDQIIILEGIHGLDPRLLPDHCLPAPSASMRPR